MTTEFFINILSDHINRIPTEKPSFDIDWESLIKMAKQQEVSGILFYQCKNFIPIEYKGLLEQSFASTLYYYSNRINEERHILQQLKNAEIDCFIIKGSTVANFYPIPALRTMGDTDIVVNNLKIAHEVLLDNGYRCKIKYASYFKRELLFEIHDQLAKESSLMDTNIISFFNDYREKVINSELDWSFHYLFLIFHLYRHFLNEGIGIRQFLDIAMVTKYCSALDWPWIEKELKELAMWSFSQKVYFLIQKWFGISPPLHLETVDSAFYDAATAELCSGSVFGNKTNKARRIVTNTSKRPIISMIERVKCLLFVPYNNMILLPQYQFLTGRPYLLPIAWIYRGWISIRKHGTKSSIKEIKSSFVSKDDIKNEQEYIEKWTK